MSFFSHARGLKTKNKKTNLNGLRRLCVYSSMTIINVQFSKKEFFYGKELTKDNIKGMCMINVTNGLQIAATHGLFLDSAKLIMMKNCLKKLTYLMILILKYTAI